MRSRLSVVPAKSSTTSAATPTVWPSPTTGYSKWTATASRFAWKDYKHEAARRTMTLDADEFSAASCCTCCPTACSTIRHYGFLANRHRQTSSRCVANCCMHRTPDRRASSSGRLS